MTDTNAVAGKFLSHVLVGLLLAAASLLATLVIHRWGVAFIPLDWFLGAPYPREKYLLAQLCWFAAVAVACATVLAGVAAQSRILPDAAGVLAGSAFAGMLFALLQWFRVFDLQPTWFVIAQSVLIVLQLPFAVMAWRLSARRKSRAA